MPDEPETNATAGQVESDLPCERCGYNLRTLAWDARCPECNTPADHSVLPRGFRFHGRREAYRFRKGLLVLILSVLIATCATIGYTLVMRYWYRLPSMAWFRSAHYAWAYSSQAAQVLEVLAIWIIVWPHRSLTDHRRPHLRLATVITALTALVASLAEWALSWAFDPNVLYYSLPFCVVFGVLKLCRPASLILLWACLLASLDRSTLRRLWIVVCMTFAAPILTLPAVVFNGIFYIDWSLPGSNHWWNMGQLATWWNKHIDAAAWIVMLLVVWMILRKLDAALWNAVGGRRHPGRWNSPTSRA